VNAVVGKSIYANGGEQGKVSAFIPASATQLPVGSSMYKEL
jgi:hypothetical protein